MRDAERKSAKQARTLRSNMTRAEVILWQCLRRRQLGGFRFRRQVPIGPYIADFACHEAKLVVEVDGATHAESHDVKRDARRTVFLGQEGWHVHRVWNTDIYNDLRGVLDGLLFKLHKSGRS